MRDLMEKASPMWRLASLVVLGMLAILFLASKVEKRSAPEVEIRCAVAQINRNGAKLDSLITRIDVLLARDALRRPDSTHWR